METLEQKWETKIQAVVHQLEYEGSDRVYFRVIYAVKYITKLCGQNCPSPKAPKGVEAGVWVDHILLFFGLTNILCPIPVANYLK